MILMQTLHHDRSREVEAILTERRLRSEVTADETSVVAAQPHPAAALAARVSRVLRVRWGVIVARA
jgi:hypothetical protein